MNALLENSRNPSANHWDLWVSPSSNQVNTLKQLNPELQSRVLLLHPKNKDMIMSSLLQALESGLYSTIRLAKRNLAQREQNILQLRAIRSGVSIEWTDSQPSLNKASQLSLI